MTQPPTPRPPDDRQFARDVAKQLDRRRIRRRLTLWTVLLALVAAAALYLRCGGGFGLLGIGGAGDGSGRAPRPLAEPPRCAIHVSVAGITVGGHAMSRDEAVAACKAAPGVDIIPTGDARYGDLEEVRGALVAAGAKNVVLQPPPRATEEPSQPARH